MNLKGKSTRVHCVVPPKVVKDFAGARGLVTSAMKELPQSVSLQQAVEQIRLFSEKSRKSSQSSKLAH